MRSLKINNYIAWACSYNQNSGEGILAKAFVDSIILLNRDVIFFIYDGYYVYKIKNNLVRKKKLNNKILQINRNFIKKYISPFIGCIFMYRIKLKKKYEKLFYINYLPLWNTILFIALPFNVILGPIVGARSNINIINNLNERFIRNYIFEMLYFFSNLVIFFKYKNIIVGNPLTFKLIYSINKIKILNTNFSSTLYRSPNDIKYNKPFDFIIYYRIHPTKNNTIVEQLIETLSHKNLIINIVGDRYENPNIINHGYLLNDELLLLMRKCKFSINLSSNPFSLINYDLLENAVINFIYDPYSLIVNDNEQLFNNKLVFIVEKLNFSYIYLSIEYFIKNYYSIINSINLSEIKKINLSSRENLIKYIGE
jgi:hypothetical protein